MSAVQDNKRPFSPQQGSSLLVFVLATIFSSIVTLFSTVFMVLGTGLASSPEEPVERLSTILWGIAAFSLVPSTILVVLLVAQHRRAIANILAAMVAAAGIAAGAAWFVDADGAMPGNTWGNAIVIAVIAIPLTCGVLMLWRAKSLPA